VFVDKLSKMVHYAACKTTVSAPELAKIFFRQVARYHGLPKAIISDRDPRFTSKFWRALWAETGTELRMSTAYHPQSDGQTERANRTLEEALRAYVNYQQDDWDERLTALEISANNRTQDSTGFSPFFMNTGQHPHWPSTLLTEKSNVPTAQTLLHRLYQHIAVAKEHLRLAQQR
jgi:transposase InsO family protein